MLSLPMTKLERFIRENDLRPAQIAREAEISRAHLRRLRKQIGDPTRMMMIRIAGACSRILRRGVKVEELFNLTVHWR